jgi:hypothetical protein
MPATPNTATLPGAAKEAAIVTAHHPGSQILHPSAATHDEILDALRDCSSVHFACHVHNDATDPSASCIVVNGRPITVAEIFQLRSKRREFAYLSACSTMRTAPILADESIHITSSFQLAGFRDVIGTMWEIRDRPAVRMADTVYSFLNPANSHRDTLHRRCTMPFAKPANGPDPTWRQGRPTYMQACRSIKRHSRVELRRSFRLMASEPTPRTAMPRRTFYEMASSRQMSAHAAWRANFRKHGNSGVRRAVTPIDCRVPNVLLRHEGSGQGTAGFQPLRCGEPRRGRPKVAGQQCAATSPNAA